MAAVVCWHAHKVRGCPRGDWVESTHTARRDFYVVTHVVISEMFIWQLCSGKVIASTTKHINDDDDDDDVHLMAISNNVYRPLYTAWWDETQPLPNVTSPSVLKTVAHGPSLCRQNLLFAFQNNGPSQDEFPGNIFYDLTFLVSRGIIGESSLAASYSLGSAVSSATGSTLITLYWTNLAKHSVLLLAVKL